MAENERLFTTLEHSHSMATDYGSLNTTDTASIGGGCLDSSDEKMRRRLKYFFMTPCEKYQARGRVPWKLLLQLVKVVVVTAQLYVFGIELSNQVAFIEATKAALRHLYLQGWDASWDVSSSGHGPFAVYTYDAMYSTIDSALIGYNQTQTALGSFDLPDGALQPQLCIRYYPNLTVDAASFQFHIDSRANESCFAMHQMQGANGSYVYDTQRLLSETKNFHLNFDNVQVATLQFSINAIHFNFDAPRLTNAECFLFDVTVTLDNQAHSGQVLVSLDTEPVTKHCDVNTKRNTSGKEVLYTFLDAAVILVCVLSCASCVRSLLRGNKMRLRTLKYFREKQAYQLSIDEQFDFINLWFVLIIVNDVLSLVGSMLKILIEYKFVFSYVVCSLFLGSGAMLVWFGTLRYLGYFSKYNALLLTIKRSLSDILRFMVCAVVLFLAFSLFGWIIFGPYHSKFRSFFTTLECLFALVNGDDVFATFAMLPLTGTNTYIFAVSRIYLYTFISLFTYIVLNVCFSIIIEAYETVKHFDQLLNGSRMWQFISGCQDPASSVAYRHDAAERASIGAATTGPLAWLMRRLQASLVSRVRVQRRGDGCGAAGSVGVGVGVGGRRRRPNIDHHAAEPPDGAKAAATTADDADGGSSEALAEHRGQHQHHSWSGSIQRQQLREQVEQPAEIL